MKKFLKDFKAFIAQGNVLDLAVGVIIGAAFKDIVTALTEKIIQPILNCIGSTEIGLKFPLKESAAEATTIDLGAFITAFINFVIMAFVIFCIVKAVNKAMTIGKKEEAPAAPTTKTCPFCKSEIDIEATKCPHCTSDITE